MNENHYILFKISLKFYPRHLAHHKISLIQVMNGVVARQQAIAWTNNDKDPWHHVGGLMHKSRNSIANALELRLSCINSLMWHH